MQNSHCIKIKESSIVMVSNLNHKVYPFVFLIAFTISCVAQDCSENSLGNFLQVGSYELDVNDRVHSFCYSVPASLDVADQQVSALVTFGRIEQRHGVLYGKKSYSVMGKYSPATNSLSIVVSILEKYELSKVQVIFMLSINPSYFYLASFIDYQWDWKSGLCAQSIPQLQQSDLDFEQEAGQSEDSSTPKYESGGEAVTLSIGIPDYVFDGGSERKAIAMLSGLHCPTENCSVYMASAAMKGRHTVEITYQFTKIMDILSSSAPMQIFISYIVYNPTSLSVSFIAEPPHAHKLAGSRKYTNNIVESYPKNLQGVKDNESSSYGGLDINRRGDANLEEETTVGVLQRIQSVLNWFSLITIEQLTYETRSSDPRLNGRCISRNGCMERKGLIEETNFIQLNKGNSKICRLN